MDFATKLYMQTDRSSEVFELGQVLREVPVIFAPDYNRENSKRAVISGTVATMLMGEEGQSYIVLLDGTTIKTWAPYFSDKLAARKINPSVASQKR